MQFYKIEMTISADAEEIMENPSKRRPRGLVERDFGSKIAGLCAKHSDKIADKGFFFLSSVLWGVCTFGMVITDELDIWKYVDSFAKLVKQEVKDIEIRETTLSCFLEMLNSASRNNYVDDTDGILRDYDLYNLVVRRGFRHESLSYEEGMLIGREKRAIYLSADRYFTKESLLPELDRIFADVTRKRAYGHPVDYMIETDDERTQAGVSRLLLESLYNVGRIRNRRYCELDIEPEMSFSASTAESLYKSCIGGAVIINFAEYDLGEDDDMAHGEFHYLDVLCEIIRRHCSNVLTIICLPRECTLLKRMIYENTGNCTFVEIREELAVDDAAVGYLKQRAREYKIRVDKNLLSVIEKGHGYLVTELNGFFDEWYSEKLKTTVYSQYKDIASARSKVKDSKPKGSAYDELESMIGLESAKEIMNQALDTYKAQKIFKDKGMKVDTMCNHMIFTGNPGTAKTTVARLFARILKDNEVLSRGHIVEVGRSDLVGKFVGWTAPTVKRRFKEAIGGILFIDEAYSLVDERDGMYGDEAINTIVQEMENHRDELIVIFAGYPDKMEGFLDKNPGLRSRIAHYVHFEDYNADELCQIAAHIASQKGMVIDAEAMDKIRVIMNEARTQDDFGNGRYVRNVIEKARMAQSSRLVHMDFESVSREDVKTIRAEDIILPVQNKKTVSRIGFAV